MFLHKIYRLFCLPVMFFNFIVLCVLRSEPSIIHFPTLTLNSLGVHTKDHLISKFKLIYLSIILYSPNMFYSSHLLWEWHTALGRSGCRSYYISRRERIYKIFQDFLPSGLSGFFSCHLCLVLECIPAMLWPAKRLSARWTHKSRCPAVDIFYFCNSRLDLSSEVPCFV